MAWTNLVAGIGLGALGLYFWRGAGRISAEEAEAFGALRGHRRGRFWSYRVIGVLLVALAIALVVVGVA
jgi:hypothetical protein